MFCLRNIKQRSQHVCSRNQPSSECTLNSLCVSLQTEPRLGRDSPGTGGTLQSAVLALLDSAFPAAIPLLSQENRSSQFFWSHPWGFSFPPCPGKLPLPILLMKDLAERQSRLKVKTTPGSCRMDTDRTFQCLNDQPVKYNWDYQQINHHHRT